MTLDQPAAGEPVRLHLGASGARRICVLLSSYPTVFSCLLQAGGALAPTLPGVVTRRLTAELDGRSLAALQPMRQVGGSLVPDCLQPPFVHGTDMTFDESVDALRSGLDQAVAADVAASFPAGVPAGWQSVLRAPGRWLTCVVDAVCRIHRVLAPVLRRCEILMRHEIDRIGHAVVRGMTDVVLAGLSERLGYTDETLVHRRPTGGEHHLGRRRLALLPMASGPGLLMTAYDLPDVVVIGYPLRSVDFSGRRRPVPQVAGLGQLLGSGPARVLEVLDRPVTMRQVCELLQVAPATATGYVDRLARVRLVVRHRAGRSVLVDRTTRGAELVQLMSA